MELIAVLFVSLYIPLLYFGWFCIGKIFAACMLCMGFVFQSVASIGVRLLSGWVSTVSFGCTISLWCLRIV